MTKTKSIISKSDVSILISLIALSVSIFTFWYLEIREKENVIATILEPVFSKDAAYSLQVSFTNTGNRQAAISDAYINLVQTDNEPRGLAAKWKGIPSIVLEPGMVTVHTLNFGDAKGGDISHYFQFADRADLYLQFKIIDSHGHLHEIAHKIGHSYIEYEVPVTVLDGPIPRSFNLLPSPLIQKNRGAYSVRLPEGKGPLSTTIFFDPITGEPRVEPTKGTLDSLQNNG